MKALALAPALALAAFALLAPSQAEAAHRHYRGCGHGSYRSYYAPRYSYGYRYYNPAPYYRSDYYYDDDYYDSGYYRAPRRGYGYYGYGYGYVPPPPPPPPRYFRRHRPRIGIYLGF